MKRRITGKQIERFAADLQNEEKSRATVEKYVRDVRRFHEFLDGRRVSREQVLVFKRYLIEHYKPASVNSMLAALNKYFRWLGAAEYQVSPLKIQRQIFLAPQRELSAAEYVRLLKAARRSGRVRLSLLMQTICATGIRVSELPYITVESLYKRQAVIECKNKIRVVLISGEICRMLKQYVREQEIAAGPVFVSDQGTALGRSYIWSEMKKLAGLAGVAAEKVFPHNLRHLFARTYYKKQKDIVKLADILGHSSINTTRIYTMETEKEHAASLENLGLIMNGTDT